MNSQQQDALICLTRKNCNIFGGVDLFQPQGRLYLLLMPLFNMKLREI